MERGRQLPKECRNLPPLCSWFGPTIVVFVLCSQCKTRPGPGSCGAVPLARLGSAPGLWGHSTALPLIRIKVAPPVRPCCPRGQAEVAVCVTWAGGQPPDSPQGWAGHFCPPGGHRDTAQGLL